MPGTLVRNLAAIRKWLAQLGALPSGSLDAIMRSSNLSERGTMVEGAGEANIRLLGLAEARGTVLRRLPPEDVALPPSVQERISTVFGEPLSADEVVRRIIADVRGRGDAALYDLTAKLDGVRLARLEVPSLEVHAALRGVEAKLLAALELAARHIADFHSRQRPTSWFEPTSHGTLGQLVRPLERVGIYAPGGRAVYPSTVLMTAIPARVAGVREIILVSPPDSSGNVAPAVLAAAQVANVDRVFAVGGAQAIAALAYGTESVPKVDKIVGPGNIFVALAKKQVFGAVGIDSIAGPTETLIIADDLADPDWVATDLLAQAEHDPLATALLLTPSRGLADAVREAVERRLASLPRREIATASLAGNGAIVLVDSLPEAMRAANDYAPEHLCLMVAEPWAYLEMVENAGAVFLGNTSPEAMGDYTAGPSHVLPTGGTARYASPLNVNDFVKTTSLISVDTRALQGQAAAAITIAEAEGLTAHADAVRARLGG